MPDQTRQYAATLDGIRADHVERYRFAIANLPTRAKVLDLACGCGYGTRMLFDAGFTVAGVDIDAGAIRHANRFFPGPLYLCDSAEEVGSMEWLEALVSFETLEHLDDPGKVLAAIRATFVIASVPNEVLYPFVAERFAGDAYPHKRHYTPEQFDALLEGAGYEVTGRYCQVDKSAAVTPGTNGIFLVYVGRRQA